MSSMCFSMGHFLAYFGCYHEQSMHRIHIHTECRKESVAAYENENIKK